MDDISTDAPRSAWSEYWEGAADGPDATTQALRGESHAAALAAFWRPLIEQTLAGRAHTRLLDAACGSGVVGRIALELAKDSSDLEIEIHCSDYSPAAIASAILPVAGRKRLGAAADARAMPYRDDAFDVVVTQFGLEYAGLGGFREAARVVAPTGSFTAVIHLADGAIYRECAGNLAVLRAVEGSGLLRLHARLLTLAGRIDHGQAAPQALNRLLTQVAAATEALGAVLAVSSPGAAREHARRLLADLPQLFECRRNYAPGVAEHWIETQVSDLASFSARMKSMLGAALDRAAITEVGTLFAAEGLTRVVIDQLCLDSDGVPAAWTISAQGA
jgi:SAM-dependent methyltransferase